MSSYRYARIINLTNNQYDIGGSFAGDTFGQPKALSPRPQYPEITVVGLTGNIKPNLIADFRFSYQREYWQWFDDGAPGQLPGMNGALKSPPATAPPLKARAH